MPYIKCKDGNIYSRYDQSKYVTNCIKEEQADYNLYLKRKAEWCESHPVECEEEKFQKETVPCLIFFSISILFLVLVVYLIKKFISDLK